ncbi:MAG: polysaccharide biosynthesis tyrosine autokinase [Verrucomicrobia bacterium]|jgi:polysaccharide biosynthesis transport protein|nr:polysaccharide biosynthesis tyrosine autokinase [Verrucomicrobiota bacterium]
MPTDSQQPQIVYQLAEPEDSNSQGPEVHLWDYVQIVLQRLPLALLVGSSVVVLAALYTWTRTPRFTSTAQLLVEPGQVNLTDLKDAIDPVVSTIGKREYMQTQANLLTSRPVAEAVIEKLSLLAVKDFRKAKDPVRELREIIKVMPVRNTQLIDISVEREDPGEAQRILHAVLAAYMNDSRARRLGVSEEGLDELRRKAEILRQKLATATGALQTFMVENDMVSFEKSQNVIMDRLRDLSKELTTLQPRRMALQAGVEAADAAIANGESVTSLPDVIDNLVVKDLKLELSRLGNEYSQLVQRLGENHPNLQATLTQIHTLQTKLAMEANAIVSSLRTQYQQAMVEERLLSEAIEAQQQEVYRFNQLTTEYDVLRRTADSIEGPYTTITRRIEEIDINRIGGQGENVFVVAKASLPSVKSWPSKAKHLLVGFILAGGLAVGLCFFLDYMDTTVKGETDVRRILRSKVLAAVPDMRQKGKGEGESDLVVMDNPRSHTAEAFRAMRTALAFSIPGERISSVVISSTLPSEGKSLTAINLAIAQAQSNKRTLLVDADMRKPRLHRVFKAKGKLGLSSLLSANGHELSDVIQKTPVENLDFIPCGPIPRNPAELLEDQRFKDCLLQFRENYDFVVFDSPPGFSLVDSLIIGKFTDGLLLVVRSFVTPKAAAQQFGTRLAEANVRLLGVAMNNVDIPRGGHYYGGYYYGGKKYAKYYREEDVTA